MSENRLKTSVWQLGGGTAGKSCADDFLKYGVALIGPGSLGKWDRSYPKDGGMGAIRQFVEDVRVGDIVVLRQGQSAVRAIGIFEGEYEYLPQFEDVDGWDLQHARRVRWFPLPEEYKFQGPVFGANPSRFSGVSKPEVLAYIQSLIQSPPTDWQTAPMRDLPEPEADLENIPSAIAGIVAAARDIVPMFWNPKQFGEVPTEDELVAHFTVPLLRALGWAPELIAIKWHYVDITLFERLPRKPENCRIIVEAKRFDTGFEAALKQARGYLKKLDLRCDILITDGIRYRLYSSEEAYCAVAYANLACLKLSAELLFEKIQRK